MSVAAFASPFSILPLNTVSFRSVSRAKPISSRCVVRAVASGETKTEIITDGVANGMDLVDVSESEIRTLDDVEEILGLVEQFGVYDLRVESHGVVVEVSRRGGRGFEDGKLATTSQIGAGVQSAYTAVEQAVVEDDVFVDEVVEEEELEEEEKEEEKEKEKQPEDFVVKSNRVGFFYSGPKNKPPLVNVGDHVELNQPVCIIEQLGQQYVYLSEACGTVETMLVEDGDAVEYGQDVMVIRPD